MKSVLQRQKINPYLAPTTTHLSECLPYYLSNHNSGSYNTKMVHIIRSGLVHWTSDKRDQVRHLSYNFWCGGAGSTGKGELMDDPGALTVCRRCLEAHGKSPNKTLKQ
jgi:hypothetical protein